MGGAPTHHSDHPKPRGARCRDLDTPKSVGPESLQAPGASLSIPISPAWDLYCLPCPQHLARYVEQYVGADGTSGTASEGFLLKPVFLQR